MFNAQRQRFRRSFLIERRYSRSINSPEFSWENWPDFKRIRCKKGGTREEVDAAYYLDWLSEEVEPISRDEDRGHAATAQWSS